MLAPTFTTNTPKDAKGLKLRFYSYFGNLGKKFILDDWSVEEERLLTPPLPHSPTPSLPPTP
ncbi:hypothetical protein [Argonema antarcticum]|uniref:hypothetical protein n=1 Tax=Argonema antarcticum TaxID=2942763 RepID=UPI002011BA2F|nr:hypothetical protein [Argonema antarcticum]MCL1472494.1 hypothetical protein [Argonema antarcticum A004/B2]